MPYLYEKILSEFGRRTIQEQEVPGCVHANLNPKYGIRQYQKEAIQRFLLLHKNPEIDGKRLSKPYHWLYNMATGSGKTLLMAALMLYLRQQGHGNFMFFVNSSNIIKKTKDNFLNPLSSKYLFGNKIVIDGREISVKEVDNFDEADDQSINIKFTTIQKLHSDLHTAKENSVTMEDFAARNLVLIADEAHHLSAATQSNQKLFSESRSWEEIVMGLLHANSNNMLLEFTATLNYGNNEINEKYKDKVIFKYGLAQFRNDKYSKEIDIIQSRQDEEQRICRALVMNLYRQELAAANGISLKPVILFKSQKTIQQSENNKTNFHRLIANFSPTHLESASDGASTSIQKALTFLTERKGLSLAQIAERIKSNFVEENCLSANNNEQAETNQMLLNSLEDGDNPIRAIFAVQKLNEGWDVLNLYDIVRLYEGSGGNRQGANTTTISEAQLIGRGARYFPFAIEKGQDMYKRKYDDDVGNDLRVLECLHYHAKDEPVYIRLLKNELSQVGIWDNNTEVKQLTLKAEFKKTAFYQTGMVAFNERVKRDYSSVKSFAGLGVVKKNFCYQIAAGDDYETTIMDDDGQIDNTSMESKDIPLSHISIHVIRHAMDGNGFYKFDNLTKYFPHLKSSADFICADNYLGGLTITLKAPTSAAFINISNHQYMEAMQKMLKEIEAQVKANTTKYQGSDYKTAPIKEKFKDKKLTIKKDDNRTDGQESFVADKSWYVYNANYGTDQEKDFVKFFARHMAQLKNDYKDIYLIRNEREIKIIDNQGRAFEPDFLLFCRQKSGDDFVYQVFIEPKGGFLQKHDQWKEDFLNNIRKDQKAIRVNVDNYLITALPFYNSNDENEFKKVLDETLLK